jgi:hypothetical protein
LRRLETAATTIQRLNAFTVAQCLCVLSTLIASRNSAARS